LALAVALVEFVGGIMLVLGLLTRPVAIAVAVFMSQAVAFHFDNGFKWTDGGYEFPLMWMVAALFFAVRGGGYLSVDQKIGKEF
jgi:putative oxidoreductase